MPNHRALIAQVDQELERAQRYDRVCSLLFLDLDHFKALNDGYGHTVGDAVLCELADLVRSQLRGMDTAGRWGGEEFMVILVAEEAIPFGARILMVVDAYQTMIMDRPSRKASAPSAALAELRRCASSQFDPQVVVALTRLLRYSAEGVE